jgi:hypothetical protein
MAPWITSIPINSKKATNILATPANMLSVPAVVGIAVFLIGIYLPTRID